MQSKSEVKEVHTASLEKGAQLFVWSMRQWVVSARAKRCIVADLAPQYLRAGCRRGVEEMDEIMSLLSVAAFRPVELRCPCNAMLSDDEHALLNTLRFVQRGRNELAAKQLSTLLVGRLNRSFLRAAEDYAAILRDANLSLTGVRHLALVKTSESS